MSLPGTMRGDQAVYTGRRCIGYLRASYGGVIAFGADRAKVGAFPNAKAATEALMARAASSREGAA